MHSLTCIILAAGDSSRMGAPKALLEHEGRTFLCRICAAVAAAGVKDIVVVAGRHFEEIRRAAPGFGERYVPNPAPEGGMISSVRAGLRAVPDNASGALIALVDQPAIAEDIFRIVAGAHEETPGDIIIPRYLGKKRGHPIVLPRAVFPLCFAGPDNLGLHWVTHHASVTVRDIDFSDRSIISDIDTPEDYRKLKGELTNGS
ncbi:MAG: nucleotidyltransferase family protein [Elusimicrobiaceae bacterium]